MLRKYSINSALIAILTIYLVSCAGNSNDEIQTLPQLAPALNEQVAMDILPAPGDADAMMATTLRRGTSDIEGNADGWTPNVFGDGEFSQDGTALVIDTDSQTRVGALYRLVFADGAIYEKQIPYIYPYEIKINTDGGGPIYVMLPDYKRNRWDVLDGTTFAGNTISVPGGLTGNHGNAAGSIVFGIVAWDGSDVRIESVDLVLPDIPAAGQPIDYHQFIEAEDGTLLATNIYLPYAETNPFIPDPPYPAVLIRTPYHKDFVDTSIIKPLTDVNVTVLVQYFRGRLADSGDWPDSGGTELLFTDHAGPDHTDALDTVGWMKDRHWYNGKVVASGPSALGLWIYQAAPALGSDLTGFYPIVASGDIAQWALFENGALKQSNVEIFLGGNGYPPELLQQVIDNFSDTDYIESFDYDSRAGEVTAPAFHETGWYDVNVDATINSWRALNDNGGVGAAGNHWLIIGPWHHESVRLQSTGELTFPVGGRNDPTALPVFDPSYTWDGIEWAPGLLLPPNPLVPDPPAARVLAYFIGEEASTTAPANTWYEFDNWPPAYVEQDMHLTVAGTLSDAPDGSPDALGFSLDPVNPIETIGGALLPGPGGGDAIVAGPYDQSSLLPNINILEFRGDALAQPLSIAGPILANLFVSTDSVDTDVCVKLIDEYPGGEKILVTDGIMRLSHASPGDHSGGATVELNWNIGSRAYVFGTGHRLVLHVQGTNYPKYNPNPGNGDAYFDAEAPEGAVVQTNQIKLGPVESSKLILPVFDPTT